MALKTRQQELKEAMARKADPAWPKCGSCREPLPGGEDGRLCYVCSSPVQQHYYPDPPATLESAEIIEFESYPDQFIDVLEPLEQYHKYRKDR